MRDQQKTATAGGSTPSSPTVAPKSAESEPMTTTRDIEQNTYTSERSEQLREGNLSTR